MINDAGELCPSIASQPLGFLLIFNSYINYIIYIYIYIYKMQLIGTYQRKEKAGIILIVAQCMNHDTMNIR